MTEPPHAGSTAVPRRMVPVLVVATISTVYPGFLIGALSVQVSGEFAVSEATYGWGLGSFFLAAAAGSVMLGRLVQAIGPRRQIVAALTATFLADLGIALFAKSFGMVLVGLVVVGLMNSGNQTAVNLALTRADLPRLGLAIALKQSGMPAASVLSGFAVPVIALTVGWRWAFVLGAAIALVAIVGVLVSVPPMAADPKAPRAIPVSPPKALLVAAVATGLMAFAAGALNAWIVGSGVDVGISAGRAGAMLGVGASAGITLRLLSGWKLDSMRRRPFAVAGATAALGALGMGTLALRMPAVHALATLVAFGGGWIWPVFTNFGIVRTNAVAAGSATGITQTGVYLGVFLGPLVTGALIESSGYPTMWLVVAAVAVAGAVTAASVADHF